MTAAPVPGDACVLPGSLVGDCTFFRGAALTVLIRCPSVIHLPLDMGEGFFDVEVHFFCWLPIVPVHSDSPAEAT